MTLIDEGLLLNKDLLYRTEKHFLIKHIRLYENYVFGPRHIKMFSPFVDVAEL
jgi:hypothetical protein